MAIALDSLGDLLLSQAFKLFKSRLLDIGQQDLYAASQKICCLLCFHLPLSVFNAAMCFVFLNPHERVLSH